MNPAPYNPVLDEAGRPVFNAKIDGVAATHFKLIADVAIGAMLETDILHAADVLRFTAGHAAEQMAQIWYLGLSPIGFAQLEDLKARFEVYAAELLDVMMDAGIRDEVWLGVACDAFLIGGLAAFDRLLACPSPGRG